MDRSTDRSVGPPIPRSIVASKDPWLDRHINGYATRSEDRSMDQSIREVPGGAPKRGRCTETIGASPLAKNG
eukprot:11217090-Lingulodinium_polyedra.AAC.1